MELALLGPFLIGAIGVVIFLIVLAVVFKAFYKKVDQGTALIVNDMSSTPKVHFTGALIIPVLYRAELMRISLITLQIDRRGKEGLICRDNMRADIADAHPCHPAVDRGRGHEPRHPDPPAGRPPAPAPVRRR